MDSDDEFFSEIQNKKTIIQKNPKTGKKKVVQYSKQAEKVRQEINARNARKNKGKNLVLIDRDTDEEFRYKTTEQLLSGLKSKYKKWDVSRFRFPLGADMTLKEGRTVYVFVRKMNGKQKGNLQVSSRREKMKNEKAFAVKYGRDPDRVRHITGIFAKPI
tara:strand:- start:6830 stop:7309 length:480 start_codon:yes stop_codon:yes gene_type:complete